MLVLSRHRDEAIMVGDSVKFTIIDIRPDKVRIGIEAPSDTPVHRQEVYEAIQREVKAAQSDSPAKAESCDKLAALKLVDQVFSRAAHSDDICNTGFMGDDEHEAWNAVKAAIANAERKAGQ